MIELLELSKPQDRWQLLEKFDPHTQTWIVPCLLYTSDAADE